MSGHLLRLFSCLVCLFSTSVQATCYASAAERYGVPEELIRAVAKVESGGLPADKAVNFNKNGTKDIGRMQINSGWLPTLKKYGITEEKLRDECVSIHVGTWILAQNVTAMGLSWDAVGAYNVGCKSLDKAECTKRRNKYAWKVYRAFNGQAATVVAQTTQTDRPARPEPQIGSVSLE